jgi:hypothetical protein
VCSTAGDRSRPVALAAILSYNQSMGRSSWSSSSRFRGTVRWRRPGPRGKARAGTFAVYLACRTRSARLGDGGGRRVGAASSLIRPGMPSAGAFADADMQLARVRPNRARQFTGKEACTSGTGFCSVLSVFVTLPLLCPWL